MTLETPRHWRASFILDRYGQKPAITCVDGRDFQRGDGSDFAQVLAFFIAQMEFPSCWNVPYFRGAPRRDSEGRWRSLLLHHKPANDLLRIEINGIGFHRSALCSSQALLFEAMAWYTQFPFGLERGDLSRNARGTRPQSASCGARWVRS